MANDKVISIVKTLFGLLSMIIMILCVVYLFKVRNNANEEPENRIKYINDNAYLNEYSEGDFCYNHYTPYLTDGAFKDFDIRMKKIRKFSTALLILFFVSLFLSILSFIIKIMYKSCCNTHEKCIAAILIIIFLAKIIITILSLVFFIILSVHYFKSKFSDFKDFSRCHYLGNGFREDYHFAFVVKNNFLKFFVLTVISLFLNCVENIINSIAKKK